jgi:thioredoxin 2
MSAPDNLQLIKCSQCGVTNRIANPSPAPSQEPVCGRCKTPLTTATHPLVVTDANFTILVEQATLPVLLDLWAPWCGPCRLMSPIIDQLAMELAGQVRVAKLNTDENPVTSRRFAVQGIPTLLFLKQGREIGRLVGAQLKAAILQKLWELQR